MRTAFERDGDIRSVDLAAAFATLWRERATGVISFSRADRSVRFEILEGAAVGVVSSDPSFDTAEVLMRAGKLDPSALQGRRKGARGDRALAAREQGLLTERDWRWGEKIRAVEVLADLIGWLEGRYTFGSEVTPEEGEFRVGIERLLLELFLRSRDREFIHHSLGATDAPLERADDFDEAFPALGLTTDALGVVSAIDGRATAAEISRRVPPDPFSVQKLLAALITLGLVHPEYAAERKPRAAAAPAPPPEPPAPEPAPRQPDLPVEPEVVAPPPIPERFSAPEPPLAKPPLDEPPLEEPPLDRPVEPPIEPPLEFVPDPAEPDPAVLTWDQGPPEPLDQALDLPEPPAFSQSERPGRAGVWLLAGLAIAVAALLVFRARRGETPVPAPSPRVAAALPTESGVPTASRPTPTAGAGALGAAPATSIPPTPPPPTPVPPTPLAPTATPAPTVAAATPRPTRATPVVTAEPVPRERRQWLERALRDRRALARDPRARYTIQLELVCELPSLEEAWRYDLGGAMWLLVAPHRGRECFRVFWQRFATLEEARAARSSVPRFFFTPTNHPTVVSTSPLLP